MTVYEFLDLVVSGELSELEINNYIESVTYGFQTEKLKKLLKDIDYYIFCERDDKISEYSDDDIKAEIEAFSERKKAIPYTIIPRIKLKSGEVIEETRTLDYEALLFPYHFFTVYKIQADINDIIKSNALSQSGATIQPIKIKSTLIALFCWIVNESNLLSRETDESIERFCQRICLEFNLEYTDRVRQNFSGCNTLKNRKELINKVLPGIQPGAKEKIIEYLGSKYPPKQKMFG